MSSEALVKVAEGKIKIVNVECDCFSFKTMNKSISPIKSNCEKHKRFFD